MDFSSCARCGGPIPSGSRSEFLSESSGEWELCVPDCKIEKRTMRHRHRVCELDLNRLRKMYSVKMVEV